MGAAIFCLRSTLIIGIDYQIDGHYNKFMIKTQKGSVLRVRVSSEEREALQGAAGKGVAAWARTILLNAANDAKVQNPRQSDSHAS